MSEWVVSCRSCQEPVGKPWWTGGCACDDPLTEVQAELLAVLNTAWDNMVPLDE